MVVVHAVMPPMVQHWNSVAPEEAAKVREAIQQVKTLNEAWKAKREQKQE